MDFTKALALSELKLDDDTGTVQAVIATMGVIDKDHDVTESGFFGDQKVAIAWAHDRSRVAGKGRLFESKDAARFDGQFFLDTREGSEAYKTVKAMGDLQEWSYGFHIKEGGYRLGEFDGQNVRFLQPLKDGSPGVTVAEVSPVLVGAGEGTMTTSIKSDGLRFVEQAEQVAVAAELLYARADQIKQLRADDGKELGVEAVARLMDVKTRLESAAEMFGTLAAPAVEPVTAPNADLLAARTHLVTAQAVMSARR